MVHSKMVLVDRTIDVVTIEKLYYYMVVKVTLQTIQLQLHLLQLLVVQILMVMVHQMLLLHTPSKL
jgi:hypothetical protein